jgi:hypothetical protein
MTGSCEIFQALVASKAWANDRVFAALNTGDLTAYPEALSRILRQLNHVYVVDRIFQANMQGLPHGYSTLNTPQIPLLDSLGKNVRELDAWYIDYAAGLSDSDINENISFTFVDGRAGLMTRGEMIAHVITHGMYHRGAVGQILSDNGLEPSRDGLTVFLTLSRSVKSGGIS